MYKKTVIFVFIFVIILNFFTFISSKQARNEYQPKKNINTRKIANCNKCHPTVEGKINVHIVPHSHDDVGWLKTVDQYYYGTRKDIQDAGVQFIIGSSVSALTGHPDRRFIQVETAFFWKWWQEQPAEKQQQVVDLVKNGQLEIINGGWSMNDEAAAHYHSIIDQFTWGFRFLNDTIGDCARPKVGWQIDPFGHSREHASLLKQFGFEGMVIGRLDYRDKKQRIQNKNLDFIWNTSANLNNSHLFTTMFPDFYVSPNGFCFDIVCYRYDSINPNKSSPDYNLDEKIEKFSLLVEKYIKYYKTSNVLIPMGSDFTFQAAEMHFVNIDHLINGFKGNDKYNVMYSTPSCYIEAVNAEVNAKNIKLTEKTDDFFPYASENNAVWTGYFTSRPTSKRFERFANNILQAVKQLTAFSLISDTKTQRNEDGEQHLGKLRKVMGIMQHHDAITGTEKQAVANDYMRLLTSAVRLAEQPLGRFLNQFLQISSSNPEENGGRLKLSTCLLANVSICEATNPRKFLVAVYNPLSRYVTHHVRLPVDAEDSFKITGPDGDEVYDLVNPISEFGYVKEKDVRVKQKELVFRARKVPPLGLKLYFVQKGVGSEAVLDETKKNSSFKLDSNGKLASVCLNGVEIDIEQEFGYYSGRNSGNRPSGAYIFSPREKKSVSLAPNGVSSAVFDGKLVEEVLQVFNEEVRQVIRLYKYAEEDYLEFDWLVGNLNRKNGEGREIVTKFKVKNFENGQVFYTDSNGREQIERKLNFRKDYELTQKEDEPVSNNYYPVTSKIVVRDERRNLEVAVLNDRAQGGTSLGEGEVEVMVHRRLVRDDGFGVGEALNEQEYGVGMYARGQHFLTFGRIIPENGGEGRGRSSTSKIRDLAQKKLLAPWVVVGEAEGVDSLEKMQDLFMFKFSGLMRGLPENVQILTLEPWKDDSFLLRLEHTLEKNEDEELSKPVIVDLKELFTLFDIVEIGETTLGANEWLDDYDNEEKLIWAGFADKQKENLHLDPTQPLNVLLNPMQIRTFIIKVAAVKLKK